jgi:hypothetical protein
MHPGSWSGSLRRVVGTDQHIVSRPLAPMVGNLCAKWRFVRAERDGERCGWSAVRAYEVRGGDASSADPSWRGVVTSIRTSGTKARAIRCSTGEACSLLTATVGTGASG